MQKNPSDKGKQVRLQEVSGEDFPTRATQKGK